MQELSKRTAGFTDSVIRRMTRISNQYNGINLSQGFPDFEPPVEILNRLAEVAKEGPHQYALTWGAQNFREALARKQHRVGRHKFRHERRCRDPAAHGPRAPSCSMAALVYLEQSSSRRASRSPRICPGWEMCPSSSRSNPDGPL